MKTNLEQLKPKIIQFRDYKQFDDDKFRKKFVI